MVMATAARRRMRHLLLIDDLRYVMMIAAIGDQLITKGHTGGIVKTTTLVMAMAVRKGPQVRPQHEAIDACARTILTGPLGMACVDTASSGMKG